MRKKFGSFYNFLNAAKADVSVRYSFPYVDFFGTGLFTKLSKICYNKNNEITENEQKHPFIVEQPIEIFYVVILFFGAFIFLLKRLGVTLS